MKLIDLIKNDLNEEQKQIADIFDNTKTSDVLVNKLIEKGLLNFEEDHVVDKEICKN
jgi:hypothetical protein